MSLGFGALKGMNDAIKQNRDLLKRNKKSKFEKQTTLEGLHPVKEEVLHDTVIASPEVLQEIKNRAKEADRQDRMKRLVILVSVAFVIIPAILVYVFFSRF